MNKKSILGLIIFACLITSCLFVGVNVFINQGSKIDAKQNQSYNAKDNTEKKQTDSTLTSTKVNLETDEPWLSTNPSDVDPTSNVLTDRASNDTAVGGKTVTTEPEGSAKEAEVADAKDTFGDAIQASAKLQLIVDSKKVDYKAYIPDKMIMDSQLELALAIDNPDIRVDAEAAILFDVNTGNVLYHKNAVQPMFSASTAKLLTSLVALDWCQEDEQITVGDEIKMIAPDSTRAYLREGQVLTVRNVLEGMLLPSGNDAAYVMAAYVGRKSLQNMYVGRDEAIEEFGRLMNLKAKKLGVKNSVFKTPDGYDAIGQYTTAYDMGLIGMEAAKNALITEISNKAESRNIFISGEDVTWENTNKLVKRYSGEYYSNAIGLKTGTSTMAGRCLVGAAQRDGKEVVCVILDSSAAGRWEDAIALLKYGLKQ
jgi:D-alanyl-D-alanine carboxypeptidase